MCFCVITSQAMGCSSAGEAERQAQSQGGCQVVTALPQVAASLSAA